MLRGEIRWYNFQAPDKKRPVVLLTRSSILEYLGEVTVAPITTTVRNIPSEVLLDKMDGMKRNCAVNCDHIQTLSKNKIGKLIAMLAPVKQKQLSKAIRFAINL